MTGHEVARVVAMLLIAAVFLVAALGLDEHIENKRRRKNQWWRKK